MLMCDHAREPGGREAAMIVLDPGTPERHGRDGVWCDPCLAPMVKALNDGGLRTVASCCGHGRRPGRISLVDGRDIHIMPDFESAQALSALMPYPGINDEPFRAPERESAGVDDD
jgi:hypothetical protein